MSDSGAVIAEVGISRDCVDIYLTHFFLRYFHSPELGFPCVVRGALFMLCLSKSGHNWVLSFNKINKDT